MGEPKTKIPGVWNPVPLDQQWRDRCALENLDPKTGGDLSNDQLWDREIGSSKGTTQKVEGKASRDTSFVGAYRAGNNAERGAALREKGSKARSKKATGS